MLATIRAYFLVYFALFVLCCAALGDARAGDWDVDVSFVALNKNPFSRGDAYTLNGGDVLQLEAGAPIPSTGLDPTSLLAEALGIDVRVFSARLGGYVHAKAGFRYGYYVSGGQLSITYPGTARLSIETLEPTGTKVNLGGFTISSSFRPGLVHPISFNPRVLNVGGVGYRDKSEATRALVTNSDTFIFRDPTLSTKFPWASAYAEAFFNADVDARVSFETASVFGYCVLCASKSFKVDSFGRTVPLVEIDPYSLYVLDQQVFDFGQTYYHPPLALTPNVPKLSVAGNLSADGLTLRGGDQKPIIIVEGEISKAIPVLNTVLSQHVGPFGYTLGALKGGPALELYQDVSFEPTPMVTLAFSEDVRASVNGGPYQFGKTVVFRLGESVHVKPTLGSKADLVIQPTFSLNNKFRNVLGLRPTAQITLDGPTLSGAVGSLGPLGQDVRSWNIASIPIAPFEFEVEVPAITSKPITLKKSTLVTVRESQTVLLTGSRRLGEGASAGRERYRLEFTHPASRALVGVDVEGVVETISHPGLDTPQRVLVTDHDVTVELTSGRETKTVNLGQAFCLVCSDLKPFFGRENPAIKGKRGERLFISRLDEAPRKDICVSCDPILGAKNLSLSSGKDTVEIGPLTPVLDGLLGRYPASRDGGGTSWLPDLSPHGGTFSVGDWRFTPRAVVNAVYDWQDGPRGDEEAFVSGGAEILARRNLSDTDIFTARLAISLDPLSGKSGSPLLLAAGGSASGATPLVDRQRPHDFFTEIAASYTHVFGAQDSAFVYAGLPGRAAFGPPPQLDRPAARHSPEAPISYEWFEATHFSNGVISAGFVHGDWKVDGSIFSGQEGDEDHFDIEAPDLDSASLRISWNPDLHWALQVSWADVEAPDRLAPFEDETRWSASATYNVQVGAEGLWSTTAAFGRRERSADTLDAWLIESAIRPDRDWTVWVRGERVETAALGSVGPQEVAKASIGAIRDFAIGEDLALGVGVLYSHNWTPAALDPSYGGDRDGAMAFVRFKLNE